MGNPRRFKPLRSPSGAAGSQGRGTIGIIVGSVAVGLAVGWGLTLDRGSPVPHPASHKTYYADTEPARPFALCFTGGGTNCVVDGDTAWIGGTKVRIADIDAPETHPSRCAEEARLGNAATLRLQALLAAGPFTLEPADRDIDRYGRALRIVTRGGESLGEKLVTEGLARPWTGRRMPWCF